MEQTTTKKVIMVDMDGVLCDFYGAAKKAITDNPGQKYPQSQWGFFLKLKPIHEAIESFKLLELHYDVWILTRPSPLNVNCYTEKAQWVWDNLGFKVLERTIFSCDKARVKGDYLIDDQRNANQEEFEGEWIHFATEKFPNWKTVVEYLLKKDNINSI